MKVVLHPTYFPNICTLSLLTKYDNIWEVCDNYQKQTFRNRTYICTDQGKLMLTIPVKHVGGNQGRQLYKDVKLDNSYPWQRQHWRTLQTAYRTSPFFEFYEDEIAPFFMKEYDFLLDLNLETIAFICSNMGMEMSEEKTKKYKIEIDQQKDARFLVNAKKDFQIKQTQYTQVFGDRHGFIENCSSIDLLFNEGPSSKDYLENLDVSVLNV